MEGVCEMQCVDVRFWLTFCVRMVWSRIMSARRPGVPTMRSSLPPSMRTSRSYGRNEAWVQSKRNRVDPSTRSPLTKQQCRHAHVISVKAVADEITCRYFF
eukprot:scaffold167235_cov31-Tisochrysis_lutea.AAC.3